MAAVQKNLERANANMVKAAKAATSSSAQSSDVLEKATRIDAAVTEAGDRFRARWQLEQAAREGFPVVAAAGGDGTAHEVLNGLMRVHNPNVRFTIIPIGSANDYAFSLGLDGKAAPTTRRVDVGVVRVPGGRRSMPSHDVTGPT